MKRKNTLSLTAKEKKKVKSILVEIEDFPGLLLVKIYFWVKTSPKNAQNALYFLRFYKGDDFIREENEVLFKKGYALVDVLLEIVWHEKREVWLKQLECAAQKNHRVISAVVKSLKKVEKERRSADLLASWALRAIEKERGKK